jgi:dienelactone hydrolase
MKHVALAVAALAMGYSTASAAIKTETVNYKVGDKTFKGFLAYDDAVSGKRPGILVVHEFWGLNDYARKRAEQLAGMGYVAFACDMYGDGKVGEHPKDAAAMAGEARKSKKEWLARANAGLKVLRDNPRVDANKLAAIGYCFGGSTALLLANSGADIKAVVSFHGALLVPTEAEAKGVKAKILICHGSADSFIKEETIKGMRDVYDKAGTDYAMIFFGGAVHSFTVPEADKMKMDGVRYNAAADRRSWAAMQGLFNEVFEAKK